MIAVDKENNKYLVIYIYILLYNFTFGQGNSCQIVRHHVGLFGHYMQRNPGLPAFFALLFLD